MERIDFVSFNCDFLQGAMMSNAEVAILAPVIYGYEDKYFNACAEYLKSKQEQNLEFEGFSIECLKATMGLSYIQALVVLHNIEHMPDQAPVIYNPDITE